MKQIAPYKLYQWTFFMDDTSPGTSTGDAEEYIASLGLDPRSFHSIDHMSDTCQFDRCVSEFCVTGSFALVNRLRELHDADVDSISAPPRRLEAMPATAADPHGPSPWP